LKSWDWILECDSSKYPGSGRAHEHHACDIMALIPDKCSPEQTTADNSVVNRCIVDNCDHYLSLFLTELIVRELGINGRQFPTCLLEQKRKRPGKKFGNHEKSMECGGYNQSGYNQKVVHCLIS